MAPGDERSHEEEPFHRGPDGPDPARGRCGVGAKGREASWGQRADDLQLAQALREARCRRCSSAAGARGGEDEGHREEKVVSLAARRRQVAYAVARGVSQRRACRLLSVARSALGYVSRLAQRDAPVLKAMQELARQYPRYGYRRVQ